MSQNFSDYPKYPKYPIVADNYYELFGFKPFINFTDSEFANAYDERYRYWKDISKSELMTDKSAAMTELIKARKVLTDKLEKQTYDRMLKNKLLSRLDDVIETAVKIDQELDSEEEKHIIEKGKSIGFTENEIDNRINEFIKKYDAEKVQSKTYATPIQSPITTKGLPILNIDGNKNFSFSDVKLGTTRSGTFTVRNFGGGSLQADIICNSPWLSFNTNKIHQSNLPQTLTFTVDPSKDKRCKLGASFNEDIKIVYNSGSTTKSEIISVNFTMEGYELVIKRMRSTSTGITAGISAIFLLYLLNFIQLSGWAIFGLVVSLFFCGGGLLAVKDKGDGGWWAVGFGALILLISSTKILFTCFPILLTWWIAKPVFSRYPLKSYFAGVIPVSVFLINWVGYSILSGDLKFPSFPKKESYPANVTVTEKPSYKLGTVISREGAKVRSGPSTNYKEVTALPKGQRLKVLSKSENNNWYRVEFTKDGITRTGYIHGSLLQVMGSVLELPDEPKTTIINAEGEIRGKVVDAHTGKPLVAANVVVLNTYLNAGTDANGNFSILNVPPGTYSMMTSYIGYANAEVSNIVVRSNTTTTTNFQVKQAALASKPTPSPSNDPTLVELEEALSKFEDIQSQAKVPNLVGTWEGLFDDKPIQTFIQSQDGLNLIGYNEITWSSYTSTTPFKGTLDTKNNTITLEEQGGSFGSGKFMGKLSSDRQSITGKWERYKAGQTYNWSVKFTSITVKK